jgi:hypothetical protein
MFASSSMMEVMLARSPRCSGRYYKNCMIDFKKRLSRRDTDERFHISTAQDKVKKSTKSSMRKVGTTRYGLISPFGKSKHGSILVLS